jgi:chromate reductase
MRSLQLMLISGSTRAGSSNTAALLTLQALAPAGSAADVYDGLGLLPAFNPDDDHDPLPASVADLRERLSRADAVLFCTPEYAGTLPGSLKNALDWTVRGGQLYGKPVAWINVANEGRGTGAVAHLELVLSYVGGDLVRSACLRVPVGKELIGVDGAILDPAVRRELGEVWPILAQRVARHLG